MTDKQLKRIAREMRRGILGKRSPYMMCMAVSAPLQGLLAFHGVDAELVELDFTTVNHVVLRLADGRILDATADQFGLEAVYLGELPALYQDWTANGRRQTKGAKSWTID